MPPKPKRQQQKKKEEGAPAPPPAVHAVSPPPAPGPPAAGPRRSARQAAQRAPEPEGSSTSRKSKATATTTTPTATTTTATTTEKKEKDTAKGTTGGKKRQHEEEAGTDLPTTKGKKRGGKKRQLEEGGEIDVSGTKGKKTGGKKRQLEEGGELDVSGTKGKKRGGKKRQLEEEAETDVSASGQKKKRKVTETQDEVRKEEKVVEEDESGALKKTAKKSRPPPIKTGTLNTVQERAITDLHSLRRVATTAEAKYPSPYVNTDGLWKIENEQDMPMLVKQAFSIIKCLEQPPSDIWPEGAAFAAWYRRCDTGPHFTEGEISVQTVCAATWIAAYGQIIWDDLVCSAQAAAKRCEANAPRTRRAMEVFREGEAEAARFFLVWENDGEKQVRVNGQLCEVAGTSDKFLAIGPLPSYAIIEVEETIIFWFRNREALKYETAGILEARAQKRIDEPNKIDQEEKGTPVDDLFDADEIGSNPDPDLVAALQQKEEEERAEAANREAELQRKEENRRAEEWFKIFLRGLAKHSPAYKTDPDRSEFQSVKASSMLEDTDVVLGIASVWEPLRGRGRYFAFNESMNYQYARFAAFDEENQSAPKIEAAVYTDHDLIIPVVLDSRNQSPPNSAKANPANGPVQERNKEPLFIDAHGEGDLNAHILLAFAQRQADDKVKIVVQDSRPGTVSLQRTQESVRKTICQIGWRDKDTQGHAIPLDMEPACSVEQPPVPAQEGTNMCGTYVILNAWVHMLGLPPLRKTQRPRYNRPYTQGRDRFVGAAIGMVNRALAGHMDLLTIQAFLNCYGYCDLQDPDDAGVRWPEDATARMTNYILHTLLDQQRRIEQTQLVDSLAMARKTGCSLEIARLFLEATEWNLEDAVALYWETYPDTASPADRPADGPSS